MATMSGIFSTLLFIWFVAFMFARTFVIIGFSKSHFQKDLLITFAQSFVITALVELWIMADLKFFN